MEQYHPAPPGDAAQQPPPPLPPVNGATQQLPPFSSPPSDASQQLPPFPLPTSNATQQPPPVSAPLSNATQQLPLFPQPPNNATQQLPPFPLPTSDATPQPPPLSAPLSNATQQLPPFPQPPINATQQPPPFSQPPGTPMPGISSPAPAQYSYPLPQPAQQLGHLHPQAQQYQYPAPTMTPNPHLQYLYPPPAVTPNPQHQYQYPQSMLLSTALGQRPESQHSHQPPQHPACTPTPLMPPQTSQTPNYIYTQGYPPGPPAPPQANQYQHQTPPQQPVSLGTLALGKVTSALQKLSLGGAHPGVNQGSTQPGSTLTPLSVSAPPVSLGSIPIPKPTPQPAAQQTFDRDASWRVTDPATSLPTREFTAVANFMFDKLDAGHEPKNTRLMEFSKMLPIVKHYVNLPPFEVEDKHFQTKNYGEVLAGQFGWWGVEHLLVPVCGTRLDEHFEAVAGGYHLTVNPGDVVPGSLASNKQLKASLLASYSPVLTRRGFHQWLYIIVNCPTMKVDLKRCVMGTVGKEWLMDHSNSLPNLDKYDAKPHSGTAEMIRKINDGLIEALGDRFRFTEDWAGTSIYPRGAPKQPPPAAQSTAQAPTAAQGPSQAVPGVAIASSTASAPQPAAASAAVEEAAIDQIQTAAANVNAEAQALTELRLAQHAVRANMLALDCLDASIGYSPYYRPY